METEPSSTMHTIIIVFISFIVIATVLIPVTIGIVGQDDDEYAVGYEYSYTPTVNLDDATFTFSGTALEFLTVSGTTVSGTFDTEGSYTLTITASTTQPTQTVTQTKTFIITEGTDYSDTQPLFYACVTMVMIGLVLFTIRRFMGGGGDSVRMGSSSDFSISGKMGGYGKR